MKCEIMLKGNYFMEKLFRKKRVHVAFVLAVFLLTMLAAATGLAEQEPPTATDIKFVEEPMRTFFDNRETVCGYINVPGRGDMYYYAQNDPSWDPVRYNFINEMRRGCTMGSAGCGATAFAILLRAVIPEEELLKMEMLSYNEQGYPFCICSNMPKYCTGVHERLKPETAEDFARFLPIIVSSFIGGNNQSRQAGNVLCRTLLSKLEIPYESTSKMDVALDALKKGAVIFSNTGTKASPFTKSGHYITLVSCYDGYIYIFDPYIRENYEAFDSKHVLEVIQPGFVRIEEEHMKKLCISGYTIVYPKSAANET